MQSFHSVFAARKFCKQFAAGDCSVLVRNYGTVYPLSVYEWQTAPSIWRDIYGPVRFLSNREVRG